MPDRPDLARMSALELLQRLRDRIRDVRGPAGADAHACIDELETRVRRKLAAAKEPRT